MNDVNISDELMDVIFAIIDIEHDYALDLADIMNALQVYAEWSDMTGKTDLAKILFNDKGLPRDPYEIQMAERTIEYWRKQIEGETEYDKTEYDETEYDDTFDAAGGDV